MVDIIKISDNKLENIDISAINNMPGVWILLGKKKDRKKEVENGFVCLQVGQNKDIGKEIKQDIAYMRTGNPKELGSINYVNQFGEKIFDYKNYKHWRRRNVYFQIDSAYEDFAFICIIGGNELSNIESRKKVEKYIAYKTKSVFWVNGSSFKNEQDEKSKEEILKQYNEECRELNIELSKFKMNKPLLDKIISNIVQQHTANTVFDLEK